MNLLNCKTATNIGKSVSSVFHPGAGSSRDHINEAKQLWEALWDAVCKRLIMPKHSMYSICTYIRVVEKGSMYAKDVNMPVPLVMSGNVLSHPR